ncbi:MAG TPA: site-2 protease family protein [Candidatus Limnocylindrales bacterium]|nr:site-2 protease family protein [Candidatus Limnocylindrales bacterium]
MFNLDPERLLPVLLVAGILLLVAFPIHEFSHALAAYRLGDSTARWMGRLTLNPIAHFDPLGGLFLVLTALSGFAIGWAKPTPVNPANLAGGRQGEALVAFAGPFSNLVMASIVAVPLRAIVTLGIDAPPLVVTVLAYLVLFNLLLFVFNLLPIPPLDGWKVLLSFLSPATAWQLRPYEQYGFLVLILLLVTGIFGRVVSAILFPIFELLVGSPAFL